MKDKRTIPLHTRLLDIVRFFFRVPLIENIIIVLKSKSTAFSKLVPNHYQYKPNTIRSFNRNGIHFKTDISDWLGYCAYFNIENEPYHKLLELVKPGMHILDIGTNIGFIALNMAKLCETGKVYAFEPDPYNYSKLQNNLPLNPSLPVKAFQMGMGDKAGVFKLTVPNAANRGENKISEYTTANYSEITVTTVDEFVKEQSIDKIDLIKIDTEGFEMRVLKGAEKLISQYRPVLFIEIDDENLREQKTSAKEVINHINKLGYSITSAQTGKQVTAEQDITNSHFDAVCIPN